MSAIKSGPKQIISFHMLFLFGSASQILEKCSAQAQMVICFNVDTYILLFNRSSTYEENFTREIKCYCSQK